MTNHDPHKSKLETTHYFNKVKTIQINTKLKNQPHHYAQNYIPSDDDEYYNQNHQRFSSNQRLRSYSIDQPDNFEPYIQNEQIG